MNILHLKGKMILFKHVFETQPWDAFWLFVIYYKCYFPQMTLGGKFLLTRKETLVISHINKKMHAKYNSQLPCSGEVFVNLGAKC
jgi:hypothetical protein